MATIDIRIMAHKSRQANVKKLVKVLGLTDAAVTWDDRKNGGDALYTARKAWMSPWPKGCTHRCILADDVEVCAEFKKAAQSLAELYPEDIYTLFHPNAMPEAGRIAQVCSRMAFGAGIMLPRGMIRPIFENPLRPEDDMCVTFYAITNDKRVLTPMPSIVQHMPGESLLGNAQGIASKSFDKTAREWTNKELLLIG